MSINELISVCEELTLRVQILESKLNASVTALTALAERVAALEA